MYPKDNDIKGAWKSYHIAGIILSTLLIWSLFFSKRVPLKIVSIPPFLSVLGLNIDINGVIIASIEAPYFGLFADGGDQESKRSKVKEKYFKWGLLFIGFGFLLQGMAAIYS